MRSITHEEAQTLLRVEEPIEVTRLPSGKYVDPDGDRADPKQAGPWVHDERCDGVYTEAEARALIAAAPGMRVGAGKYGRTLWTSEHRYGTTFRAKPVAKALIRKAHAAMLRGARAGDCQEGLDSAPDLDLRVNLLRDDRFCAHSDDRDGRGTTVQEALAALADALESVEDEP
jgi:hypothetical protein